MSEASAEDSSPALRERFRLVAGCLVLAAVAFSQRPGRLVSDTKLDLVIDPGAMLGRALHLWDPGGGFGQVQNQAYGYLFPMGPFFWLGDLLTFPGWVVQRLWWTLLLTVAFLGLVKLASCLSLGSPTSRLVAGLAYALSPRILTTLGPISIEAWPSALAPWVLVPLVIGVSRGSPRRAAALSALAVAAVGGVNAAATFAVVPLAGLWLLTRESGPRRRSLLIWWPVFVLVGTAWWLVPLLLLGRYSPPFLDYIETSAVTTFPTTLFDSLRGSSHWVPYVDQTWQAGNDLLSSGYIVLDSAVLIVVGLLGLMSRSNRHRQFLVLAVLLGLVMVTFGHGGAVQGWFGAGERSALDGVLAPLRNVHKFDPVLRLPLVLGLAHLLALGRRTSAEAAPTGHRSLREILRDGDRVAAVGVAVVAVIAVVGAAAPAVTGRLAPADDFEEIPRYWHRTVDWLGDDSGDSTALLVPGSSFGTYIWGTPEDEPVQALDRTPWAVRNAVPLAPAGNIRMLDALEALWASGQPSPGLAGYLARAGIGRLVVRNDLSDSGDVPDPVLVHQVLEGSPGITRVAAFGPTVGGAVRIGRLEKREGERRRVRVINNDGWQARYRAVEIYEVTGAHRAVSTPSLPVVVGGPEDLLDLLDVGQLGAEPSVLAVDTADAPTDRPADRLLLTDGQRRREANFARIHDSKSATLGRDDDGRRGAAAREYTLGDGRWETTAEILGAESVTASSSRAFADTPGPVRPEYLPFAAVDRRVETEWRSGPPRGGDQSQIAIELEGPREVRTVTVVAGADVDSRQAFTVETDRGSSRVFTAGGGQAVVVPLPAGATTSLRVVGASVTARELSLAEIRVPGVQVDRTLVLPEVPAAWGPPDSVVLSAAPGRSACVRIGADTRCGADKARQGEDAGLIDRTLRLGAGAAYQVTAAVRPMYGDALDGLLQQNQFVSVQSSSRAVDDARASGLAAIDGDPGTTWTAAPTDRAPTLSLRWIGKRDVRALTLDVDEQAPAAIPRRVRVSYPGGRQTVDLDSSGRAEVEPFRADRIEVRVVDQQRAVNRLDDGTTERLGVGVSELGIEGLGLLPVRLSDVPIDIGCGFGPTLRIGEQLYETSVLASQQELFDGDLLPARVCGPPAVDVESGETRLVLAPAPAFDSARVLLTGPGSAEPVPTVPVPVPVPVEAPSPVTRHLEVAPSGDDRTVALRENQNDGWQASVPEGESARRLTVDGWQQGWQISSGVDDLVLRYSPDGAYRLALLAGGSALLLLAGGTLLLGRRRSRGPDLPPLGPRTLPPAVMLLLGLVTLGLVAGWWGLVCAGSGAAVSVLARRWFPVEATSWAAVGLPVATAACVYWLRPLGSADGWAGALAAPQLFVAFALGALVAADLEPGRLRFLHRWQGRSTNR